MLFVLFVNEIVEFVDGGEVAEVVEPMGTGFRTAKVKNKKKTKIKHALRKIKHVKKCGLCCRYVCIMDVTFGKRTPFIPTLV